MGWRSRKWRTILGYVCGIEAQTQHHMHGRQVLPHQTHLLSSVGELKGHEMGWSSFSELSEYMHFTHSWHQYHCIVYSPMGRTSRAWVLGVLATGLLQLLYLSPASSSAFRLLPSFRAQACFLFTESKRWRTIHSYSSNSPDDFQTPRSPMPKLVEYMFWKEKVLLCNLGRPWIHDPPAPVPWVLE